MLNSPGMWLSFPKLPKLSLLSPTVNFLLRLWKDPQCFTPLPIRVGTINCSDLLRSQALQLHPFSTRGGLPWGGGLQLPYLGTQV